MGSVAALHLTARQPVGHSGNGQTHSGNGQTLISRYQPGKRTGDPRKYDTGASSGSSRPVSPLHYLLPWLMSPLHTLCIAQVLFPSPFRTRREPAA